MKDIVNDPKIRERLLASDYGKFDLIDTVYSKEEILGAIPRVLYKNIIERFSIPEKAINRKTYWSWLQRYKKKNKPSISPVVSIIQIEKSNKKTANEDWQTFEPSNAESAEQRKTIIKLIK